jgi:hypothetical protein
MLRVAVFCNSSRFIRASADDAVPLEIMEKVAISIEF